MKNFLELQDYASEDLEIPELTLLIMTLENGKFYEKSENSKCNLLGAH